MHLPLTLLQTRPFGRRAHRGGRFGAYRNGVDRRIFGNPTAAARAQQYRDCERRDERMLIE
jgi:hypothetical protein